MRGSQLDVVSSTVHSSCFSGRCRRIFEEYREGHDFDALKWPTSMLSNGPPRQVRSILLMRQEARDGEESKGGVIRTDTKGVRFRGGNGAGGGAHAGSTPADGAPGAGECPATRAQASRARAACNRAT